MHVEDHWCRDRRGGAKFRQTGSMTEDDTPYGSPGPGDSNVPGSLARVLADVAAERAAQDIQWGVQDLPDGTATAHAAVADAAKRDVRAAWQAGRLTWRHILEEEFHEALAETDPAALRTELVQTAAVAVKWAQAIDRRDGGLAHRTGTGGRTEKLVRDRVPELIRAAGGRPDVRVAADGEYLTLLRTKLYEEAGEYAASGSAEELADVLEVVYALAAAAGLSREEIEGVRAAKAARNGRFEHRRILRTTEA